MGTIKDLNLHKKLLLILLLLLIPLTYFSVNSLLLERNEAISLEETHLNLQEVEKISDVLHRIQKERALSYGFYFTSGSNFGDQLKRERILTDEAINALTAFYQQHQKSNLIQNFSDDLYLKRLEVDALDIDSLAFEAFFSNVVNKLSDQLEASSISIDDAKIRNQLEAYIQFSKAKIYLREIRSIFTRSIFSGMVSNQELIKLSGRNSLLEAAQEQFANNISQNIYDFYLEKTSTETANLVHSFINNILLLEDTDLSGEDFVFWYTTFSQYIDQLQEVDKFAITQIQTGILQQKEATDLRLLFYTIFVMAMLVLAVWLSIYIINDLLNKVNILKNVANQVAEGDTQIEVPFTSKDELGKLANSFKMVVKKNTHLAQVANDIGQGIYEIDVQVSSEKDKLANALQKMKENLKKLSEKDKKNHWMLTGSAGLSDIVSGNRNLSSVSDSILTHICQYIEAEIGVLYLFNDQHKLELAAGYAFAPKEVQIEVTDLNDNLVGQALKDKKLIRLENIKKPEFNIKTSLTTSPPAEVVILPLYLQEQPVGVIELAARRKFSADIIEFLESIAEKVVVTIVTLQADIKTAELLAETQSQAEELETQHEELRQINLELNAQKDKLQLSEEELKASQEELEEKNAELEEQYEATMQKNKELEEARHEIQLKLDELHRIGKYRSDFLANMSHELRTPLNSILILAKLIAENKEHNLTPKQVEFAEVIHNSGNDLLKLINEILDLTKIEAGKLSLEIKEFPIVQLNLEPVFSELAKERHIKFKVKFRENLPLKISSDPFRIEQILKNLLSNAFKFTEEGGQVKLDIFVPDAGKVFRKHTLNTAFKVIAFAVSDTGIGIAKEQQNIIFDAFRQADSSTTRKFGGTGLGLSICRELANLLGGEIEVESEVGKGSCFTLYISDKFNTDAVSKEEEQKVLIGEKTITKMQSEQYEIKDVIGKEELENIDDEKTLLIIEDDRGFSRILADFAKGRKIKPITTHLGKKGIELAKQIKPHAVLLDIQLPDISGWEVLEKMKQDDILKHIPVHIMSAYQLDPASQGFSKENYLPKPITLENLDQAFSKISSINKSKVKKILIIEDNKEESKAVKELLLAHELHAEIANSGEEAWIQLAKEPFDCVILDLNLPGMGGYEILDQLKTKENLRNIPVIIYSGKDFTEEEEFRLKKFVNAIVIKTDYSYKRLLDEVKLFLHKVQENISVFVPEKVYQSDESLKNRKVLLVDDDSRNIYSLYNAFESEAMNVVVANNGFEALQKLEKDSDTDIILMDIMMPEMDGLECTRRIRQNTALAGIPIIALTAKAMKEDKEKCLIAGASDYISKPVNVEKLLSLMRVWIHRNQNIHLY